jgi:hypothetical protein
MEKWLKVYDHINGLRPFWLETGGFYFFKTTGFCSCLPEVTSSQNSFSDLCQSLPKVVLKKPPSFSKSRLHPAPERGL